MGYKWPKEVKFNMMIMISVVVMVMTIMVINMVLVIMTIIVIMRSDPLVKRGIHCDYIKMEMLNLTKKFTVFLQAEERPLVQHFDGKVVITIIVIITMFVTTGVVTIVVVIII